MKTSIALKLSFFLKAYFVKALFFYKSIFRPITWAIILLLSAGFSWSFSDNSVINSESDFFTSTIIEQHIHLLDLSKNDDFEVQLTLTNLHQTLLARLPCDKEAIMFTHIGKNTTGNVRYQANCDGAQTNKITLNLNIKLLLPVLLTKRALNTNSSIKASDLYFKKLDISRLHTGYFSNMEEVIGLDIRRTLPAGKILNPLLVQPPLLINKGDEVIIWANIPGLNIRMTGVAMTSGRKGKQISVKNKSSGKIIKARVIDNAVVQVI